MKNILNETYKHQCKPSSDIFVKQETKFSGCCQATL